MAPVTMRILVIFCFDGRIRLGFIDEAMLNLGYESGTFDHLSVAGAAKYLASGSDAECGFMLNKVQISLEKHGIPEGVVILLHERCAAYNTPDSEREIRIQFRDLEIIAARLQSRFPGLPVRGGIITGTETRNLAVEIMSITIRPAMPV